MRWELLCSQRSVRKQYEVLKNLLLELNIYSQTWPPGGGVVLSLYQPIEKVGGGQEIDGQCNIIDSFSWISGPIYCTMEQALQLFCYWRRWIMLIFVYTSNTRKTNKRVQIFFINYAMLHIFSLLFKTYWIQKHTTEKVWIYTCIQYIYSSSHLTPELMPSVLQKLIAKGVVIQFQGFMFFVTGCISF
jgi:hypothetical protein